MSLIHNEQTKLTATYLNTAAGAFFAVGVLAPVVASAFGAAGSGSPLPTLTLAVAAPTFFVASIATHLVARRVLKRLKP